jgi:hypothetical protein
LQWSGGIPPKKRGNGWKWALGGVALLAVIAVTAVVSVSIASGGDDSPAALPGGGDSEYASANDTGPVNIITEDPTCEAWEPINRTFVEIQYQGWSDRDPTVPVSDWSAEQREQYEKVAQAARSAADQTMTLVKLTPHRVMREFYEQFISYARAYSDSIATYTPVDNYLAGVFLAASIVIVKVCDSIRWSSANARAPLVGTTSVPPESALIAGGEQLKPFLAQPLQPFCSDWMQLRDQFIEDTAEWEGVDANITASQWTPEQRGIIDRVIPVMNRYADDMDQIVAQNENPILHDFATFASQYRRAYAAALPSYTTADSYLATVAASAASMIYQACRAVGA